MIERRTFLTRATMATAVLLTAPEQLFATSTPPVTRQAFFENRLGTSLQVDAAGVRRRLEIADVVPVRVSGRNASPALEQFHVVLRGADATFQEGLCTALPENGAPMSLYLVPAGNGDVTATFCLRKS
jgi:hypothetical protein